MPQCGMLFLDFYNIVHIKLRIRFLNLTLVNLKLYLTRSQPSIIDNFRIQSLIHARFGFMNGLYIGFFLTKL
jgi:hypothetical protein